MFLEGLLHPVIVASSLSQYRNGYLRDACIQRRHRGVRHDPHAPISTWMARTSWDRPSVWRRGS